MFKDSVLREVLITSPKHGATRYICVTKRDQSNIFFLFGKGSIRAEFDLKPFLSLSS